LATASFGQGVAVTPIQLIRAVGAIANKGIMMAPQVVRELAGDNWQQEIKPSGGERVISTEAAEKITAMMVEAARNGESKWTALRGFNVAGKTGTAQIPISGYYDAEKTMASFIGFAPADNPKFVMLVTITEPQSSQWASETAAPLWYAIAKDIFSYLGVQPKN
jgi:cell division protein FtsI/penicillin-binding protein 2